MNDLSVSDIHTHMGTFALTITDDVTRLDLAVVDTPAIRTVLARWRSADGVAEIRIDITGKAGAVRPPRQASAPMHIGIAQIQHGVIHDGAAQLLIGGVEGGRRGQRRNHGILRRRLLLGRHPLGQFPLGGLLRPLLLYGFGIDKLL